MIQVITAQLKLVCENTPQSNFHFYSICVNTGPSICFPCFSSSTQILPILQQAHLKCPHVQGALPGHCNTHTPLALISTDFMSMPHIMFFSCQCYTSYHTNLTVKSLRIETLLSNDFPVSSMWITYLHNLI